MQNLILPVVFVIFVGCGMWLSLHMHSKRRPAQQASIARANQVALECNPLYQQKLAADYQHDLATGKFALEERKFYAEQQKEQQRLAVEQQKLDFERQKFYAEQQREQQKLEMERDRLHLDALKAQTWFEVGAHGAYKLDADGSLTPLPPLTRLAPGKVVEANPESVPEDLQIPPFAELLAAGEIGPGQKDMLFSFEIIRDEVTHHVALSPIRGEIGTQHTQFIVAGSQSGKTTFMAGNIGQAAAMRTLFYIIDPHKMHPEKSVSAKVAALSDWFILPPASTHEEIARVLKHATKTRDALIAGKPTPYSGYHIMVIVDEVPALMAWQRSQEKQLRQLYLELALFMQSIGTQTAKFGMTGLFASQFATKEQLGDIDIRDACMSQLIMRLHPTQAQTMRILGKEAMQEITKLPKGHGYLMLSDSSEAIRVASGNVTPHDLEMLASMLPPSPLVKVDRIRDQSQRETRSLIPFPGTVVEADETGSKLDGNQLENQIEPALQAKVDKVLGMLGQNKGDILYAVWGEKPSKSQAYQQAVKEYEQVMSIIRELAVNQRGA